MTVLFSSSSDLQLLKWEGTTENPILATADIAYNDETIGNVYSGIKLQSNRSWMIGYSRILTSGPFWKIKRNNKLFDWLHTNNIWIKTIILSSNKHVKIGLLLQSQPSYTNYARATAGFLKQIGANEAEL